MVYSRGFDEVEPHTNVLQRFLRRALGSSIAAETARRKLHDGMGEQMETTRDEMLTKK